MGRKIKYQYTYFIYPFVVKESKYQKYMLKMLRDKDIYLRIFQREKDLQLYQYFLPKMSEFLFSSFNLSELKLKKFEELPTDTKAAILSKYPCTIFAYHLPRDVQGKTEENSIFFKIQKIEVICFKTGICFLLLKTNVEDSDEFEDILNFNCKFREIENQNIGNHANIHLQTDAFDDIEELTDVIKHITGSNAETIKLDLDTQRFLSYSYICIDQQLWGANKGFENVEENFMKFSNFLSADNSVQLTKREEAITFSKWKYAQLSVSKQGVALFTSDADMYNYTKLPTEFEGVYLYTYILNLYKKIYLKKLDFEFEHPQKVSQTRKHFVEFTKQLWIQEITDDEVGSWLNHQIAKKLEVDRLYHEIKNQYDLLYKDMKVEKNTKIMIVLIAILGISLIINIISLLNLF